MAELQLDSHKTALVLIDLQNAIVGKQGGGGFGAVVDLFVGGNKALAFARDGGVSGCHRLNEGEGFCLVLEVLDGDFAAQLGEELGALFVLLALAEHDVLELTMTGHGRLPLRG